jgi:lycopene cyclase domain-containing protein
VKYEYLLLNFAILLGPLAMSFEKQIRFVAKWRHALPAILIVAVPYLIWDASVTGRHWWFNERYTLDFRLAGLPVEEWLFFFTVPFAGLFVWEVIAHYFPKRTMPRLQSIRAALCFLPLPGIMLFAAGKEYTGLVLIFLGAVMALDRALNTHLVLQNRGLIYLAAVLIFILIFNTYLTWRPVVLYDERYQLGIRLGTIPVEDFGYGISHLLLAAIVYEKLRGRCNA